MIEYPISGISKPGLHINARKYTAAECGHAVSVHNARYCAACLAKPAIAEAEHERKLAIMRRAHQRAKARKRRAQL